MKIKSIVSGEFKYFQEIIAEFKLLEHSPETILDCIKYYEEIVALCMFSSDERQSKYIYDWAKNLTSRPDFGSLFSQTLSETASAIMETAQLEKNLYSRFFSKKKLELYTSMQSVIEQVFEKKSFAKVSYWRYAHRIRKQLDYKLHDHWRAWRATLYIFPQNEIIELVEYFKRLKESIYRQKANSKITTVSIFKIVYVNSPHETTENYYVENQNNDDVLEKLDKLHHEILSWPEFSNFSREQLILFLLFPTFRKDYSTLTLIEFSKGSKSPISAIETQDGKFVWKLHAGVFAHYVKSLREYDKFKYHLFESVFIDPYKRPITGLIGKSKKIYNGTEEFMEKLVALRMPQK